MLKILYWLNAVHRSNSELDPHPIDTQNYLWFKYITMNTKKDSHLEKLEELEKRKADILCRLNAKPKPSSPLHNELAAILAKVDELRSIVSSCTWIRRGI